MRIVGYAGRGLGAVSGALVALLWTLALWIPESGMALTGINFVVALLMALLGLFAVIAAVREHAAVLLVLFVASFFPVGVALVGADHWLAWAGRLNVCYLVAAALIRLGRRRAMDAARDTAA
ncbi:MAG TPA: hypothetical protein VF339_00215 [Gammaproteobacteria bacterium]